MPFKSLFLEQSWCPKYSSQSILVVHITVGEKKEGKTWSTNFIFAEKRPGEQIVYVQFWQTTPHSVLVVCYTKSSRWNGGDATTTHSSKEIYLGWQIASFFHQHNCTSLLENFLPRPPRSQFFLCECQIALSCIIFSHSIIYWFKARLMTYWKTHNFAQQDTYVLT